jgi:serine/threonine protein kinase
MRQAPTLVRMMTRPDDGVDTALARLLHEQGTLGLGVLRECLDEVRRRRAGRTEISLAELLVSRRFVAEESIRSALGVLGEDPEPGELAEAGQPSLTLETPARLGPYRLEGELSRGGMGSVHRAVHVETGVSYALKRILGSQGDLVEDLQRFKREAEVLARLKHPNVVRIHASEIAPPNAYLVMSLLTGGTLQERIARGGLTPEDAVAVALKLASALEHLHTHGILHRDLKPENVLFDERGEPQLVDLGLALVQSTASRLTETGVIMGTPAFMPPEQAKGRKDVDERADVYSLGAVLYAMLMGRPPFQGASLFATLDKVLNELPQPPHEAGSAVPPGLSALCMRALAKDPEDRPASAAAFAEELRRATADSPYQTKTHGALALVLVLLAAVGGVLVLGLDGPPAPSPNDGSTPSRASAAEEEIEELLARLYERRSVARQVATLLEARGFDPARRQVWAKRVFEWSLEPRSEEGLEDRRSAAEIILSSLDLSETTLRRLKSEVWLASREGWADHLSQIATESGHEAHRFAELREVLRSEPALPPESIGPVTSSTMGFLLEDPTRIRRAVALQIERNQLELPSRQALKLAVHRTKEIPMGELSRIRLQVGISNRRKWSYRALKYSSGGKESAGEQLAALSVLSNLISTSVARGRSDELDGVRADRLRPCIDQAEKVLATVSQDLGLRAKLEVRLVRLHLLMLLKDSGSPSDLEWLAKEIDWRAEAQNANRVRATLLRSPDPDRLLLAALLIGEEVWLICSSESPGLRDHANEVNASAWRAGVAAALRCLRTNPFRFNAVHEEHWLYTTLLREQASHLLDLGRQTDVGGPSVAQLLSTAEAQLPLVEEETVVHKRERTIAQLKYSCVRERVRLLSLQDRLDEAAALAEQHERVAMGVLPDFCERSFELWVKRGEPQRALALFDLLDASEDGDVRAVADRLRASARALRERR